MLNIFLLQSPRHQLCQGINLSAESVDFNETQTAYVNGDRGAQLSWSIDRILLGTGYVPDLKTTVEKIGFQKNEFRLSGDLSLLKEKCVLTQEPDQGVFLTEAIVKLIPKSLFHTAGLQMAIYHNAFYQDAYFDDQFTSADYDLATAARNRKFRLGDPLPVYFPAPAQNQGVTILGDRIAEDCWRASIYEINQAPTLDVGSRLTSMTDRFVDFKKQVRAKIEIELGAVAEVLSQVRL